MLGWQHASTQLEGLDPRVHIVVRSSCGGIGLSVALMQFKSPGLVAAVGESLGLGLKQ